MCKGIEVVILEEIWGRFSTEIWGLNDPLLIEIFIM